MTRDFINYSPDEDKIKITFSLGELMIIKDFLDLLQIPSDRIYQIYYYYKCILKEPDSHYLDFITKKSYQYKQFNKVDIINNVGNMPLFDSEDIY